MKKITITIAIPVYNGETHLPKRFKELEQIVNKEPNIFISLSDNNSDDFSWKLIQDFQIKFPFKVKINRHKKNVGYDGNIIYLYKESATDFVQFLGVDDTINVPIYLMAISEIENTRSIYTFNEKRGKLNFISTRTGWISSCLYPSGYSIASPLEKFIGLGWGHYLIALSIFYFYGLENNGFDLEPIQEDCNPVEEKIWMKKGKGSIIMFQLALIFEEVYRGSGTLNFKDYNYLLDSIYGGYPRQLIKYLLYSEKNEISAKAFRRVFKKKRFVKLYSILLSLKSKFD